jgi:phage gp29-like protein
MKARYPKTAVGAALKKLGADPFAELVRMAQSTDDEAFRDGLIDLYPDLDPAAFAALMAQALAVADAAGQFEVANA